MLNCVAGKYNVPQAFRFYRDWIYYFFFEGILKAARVRVNVLTLFIFRSKFEQRSKVLDVFLDKWKSEKILLILLEFV